MNIQKKETLIIITPGFAVDENDSTCLPAHQVFVKSLKRNFPALQIIIIALQYPYKKSPYHWFGISVIPLSEKEEHKFLRPFLWSRLYSTLQTIRKQISLVKVLSFWCQEGAFVAHYFARRYNLKHLIWVTGQDARKGNRFVSLIRPKPKELIAMSDFLSDEFEKNYSIRPHYIVPNGIDPDRFPIQKIEKTIDLLGAGSLIQLKQYSIFIDVVAELVKIKPSLQAVLCGAGPEEELLKNKTKSLNLESNISFKGELPHEEVLKLMQCSKVFVHPSSYEGYSTVCLEALYAGCHVVSFIAPEKRTIHHWHIVNTSDKMKGICKELLNESDFNSVVVHRMDDCAKGMMGIFDYKEAIT